MKFIKLINALIILYVNFIIIYKISGTHIYKLDTHISDEIDLSDSLYSEDVEIFVVQNPPDTHKEMVELIYKFNKENKIESVKLPPNYSQSFYKETWEVNRFFEPYMGGFLFGEEYNFFHGNFPTAIVERIKFVYKESRNNNIDSTYKENLPYFKFNKLGSFSEIYTPNGTNKNPNDKGYDPFKKSRRAYVD